MAQQLSDLKVDELRERAKKAGITGVWSLRKEELVNKLSKSSGTRSSAIRSSSGTKKSAGAKKTTGSARPGATLITQDHDEIRRWAEERDAVPITIEGTEHGGRPGVLRLNFPGYSESERMRVISWKDWFRTFDERGLNFIYQERRANGGQSNFFRLENPDREDA